MYLHIPWKESILALLVSGCYSPNDTGFESPENYDVVVGSIQYRDETSMMYKGYECKQEMEIYSILREMNLADYINNAHDKNTNHVRVYSRWKDTTIYYNIDEAWIFLGCSDTNWLTAWLYAEGVQESDSYDYASCLYKTQLFECSNYENPHCL